MTDPMRHSLIEDVQGIAFGVCMAAVGMHVLTFSGFVAGQTTGVAALRLDPHIGARTKQAVDAHMRGVADGVQDVV